MAGFAITSALIKYPFNGFAFYIPLCAHPEMAAFRLTGLIVCFEKINKPFYTGTFSCLPVVSMTKQQTVRVCSDDVE